MNEGDVFDEYATKYEDAVNASVAISGDSVEDFAAAKARLFARELSRGRNMAVLDFGCGTGISSRAIAKSFPGLGRLSATDTSEESIRRARELTEDPRIDFKCQTDTGLPFPDATFDAAFTSCVFHHIDRTQHGRWLREIARVLKPGGDLFVFEHNPLNPLTRRAVSDCPFDKGVILLPARYTASILRSAGLDTASPRFYYFFPRFLAFLRGFERLMAWIPLGAQYYVRGRKVARPITVSA